jgi:hypothetical protein
LAGPSSIYHAMRVCVTARLGRGLG